jgi:hypothetical protein
MITKQKLTSTVSTLNPIARNTLINAAQPRDVARTGYCGNNFAYLRNNERRRTTVGMYEPAIYTVSWSCAG